MVYWFPGLLVYWSTGSLVHRFTGLLVYWFTGSLVHWFTGALVYWFTCLLVCGFSGYGYHVKPSSQPAGQPNVAQVTQIATKSAFQGLPNLAQGGASRANSD